MEKKIELWTPLADYEDKYLINTSGVIKRIIDDVALKQRMGNLGYKTVYIGRRLVFVHRLLAKTFIPNPHNKPQVNHINGVKGDNRIENLEWVTHSENCKHAFDTGLKVSVKGEHCGRSKLTKIQVEEILSSKLKNRELATIYKISIQHVRHLKKGRSWKVIKK